MQIGDKVYVYEIKLDFNKNKVEQLCNCHQIIGVNKYKFVIDDLSFTAMNREKAYKDDRVLNQVLFVDFTDWKDFGYLTGILRTMESNKKVAYKKVKRELEKYINKKLIRYGGATQLLNEIVI